MSLRAFAIVPIGPIGGWIVGHRPLTSIALGVILAATALALLPLDISPPVLLSVIGLTLGATGGPIVALPAAVLAPGHRAVGRGFFWLMFFLLMTALPPLAGLARDLTDATAAPMYMAALFTALALPVLAAYARARQPAPAIVSGD